MATVITFVLVLHLTVSITMGDCPYQECVCRNQEIRCQGVGLDEIPPLTADSVNIYPVLRIQNNRITIIPDKSIPDGLTEIDFGNNPVSTIERGAFDNSASTLETLSFTNTRLTEISDAFLSLTKLTSLTIKNSPLQYWDFDVLKSIGASLRELTLNNVGLTSWPVWISYFPHLTVLSLTNGRLTPVPDTSFDLLKGSLNSLTIASANLKSIPRALTVLSNLTSLDLSNNSITEVENLPLQSKLWSLSLAFNNISNVYKLVYELSPHAASLNYLYLHANQLPVIPQLSHMTALEVINLDTNKISDPAYGLLPSSVIHLLLSDNHFQLIPNVVRQLTKLTNLFISGNSIEEIRPNDLPVQLSLLDIQNNAIRTLQDNIFPVTSSLRTLFLSRNPLASISNSAFKNLSALETLLIGNTNLTRVPTALSDLASLNMLDLSQNTHLICTCQEAGLVKWFQARPNMNIKGTCGDDSVHDFFTTLATQCNR